MLLPSRPLRENKADLMASTITFKVAVNETSTLLTRITKIPHLHSAVNLLPAAYELETFAANYAKEHLNTSSVVMSSRTVNTKHFGKQ